MQRMATKANQKGRLSWKISDDQLDAVAKAADVLERHKHKSFSTIPVETQKRIVCLAELGMREAAHELLRDQSFDNTYLFSYSLYQFLTWHRSQTRDER